MLLLDEDTLELELILLLDEEVLELELTLDVDDEVPCNIFSVP